MVMRARTQQWPCRPVWVGGCGDPDVAPTRDLGGRRTRPGRPPTGPDFRSFGVGAPLGCPKLGAPHATVLVLVQQPAELVVASDETDPELREDFEDARARFEDLALSLCREAEDTMSSGSRHSLPRGR